MLNLTQDDCFFLGLTINWPNSRPKYSWGGGHVDCSPTKIWEFAVKVVFTLKQKTKNQSSTSFKIIVKLVFWIHISKTLFSIQQTFYFEDPFYLNPNYYFIFSHLWFFEDPFYLNPNYYFIFSHLWFSPSAPIFSSHRLDSSHLIV